MSCYLISCGGTGGHLAPGIALAEGLMTRGHRCILLISKKQVDSRLIQKYPDLEFVRVPGVGFSFGVVRMATFFYEAIKGFIFTLRLILKVKPDVVVGFGGFTTLSVSLSGFIIGVPIVLHEANRKPGRATRFLSVLARRVYLPPGVELKSLPPKTIRHFGYPVRQDIQLIDRNTACKRLGLDPTRRRILILGGSQGARSLNNWAMKHLEAFGKEDIDLYCVTGLGKVAEGKLEYIWAEGKVSQAVFVPFVDNMELVMSASDIGVCRAGAGTLAELSKCTLPSILVPYPSAADNHQLANAQFFERQGGGVVLEESELAKLYDEVKSLINNEWLVEKLRKNLSRIASDSPLESIAEDLEKLTRSIQDSSL